MPTQSYTGSKSVTNGAKPDFPRKTPAEWQEALAALGITLEQKGRAQLEGPCPVCGGTDRFHVSRIEPYLFDCRGCRDGGAIFKKAFPNSGPLRPKPPSSEEKQPSEIERTEYTNPQTGETITQIVERYRGECWRADCTDRNPHKHPRIERGKGFQGQPFAPGFRIRVHEPAAPAPGSGSCLVIAEGAKTANSVAEAGFPAASYPRGCDYAGKADYAPASGLRVLIAPDNDRAGMKAAWRSAQRCLETGAESVALLPSVGEAESGADMADVSVEERQAILSGGGEPIVSAFDAQLALAAFDLEDRCRRAPGSNLPLMESTEEADFSQQMTRARRLMLEHHVLRPQHRGESPSLYQTAGSMPLPCRVVRADGVLKLRALTSSTCSELSAEAIFWYRGTHKKVIATDAMSPEARLAAFQTAEAKPHGHVVREEGQGRKPGWKLSFPKPHNPPRAIVTALAEEAWEGLPPLEAVRAYPVLAGGTLRLKGGYVPEGKLYLDLPDGVTAGMSVSEAVGALGEVWGEYPFEMNADRANLYAMLLTPVLSVVAGIKPLFMVNKPASGTGATGLVKSVSLAVTGQLPKSFRQTKAHEEDLKQLASAANDTTGIVLADNFDGTVQGSLLESYYTDPVFHTRILGQNLRQMQVNRAHIVDAMTGNNPTWSRAMARRICRIGLDAKMVDPETRSFEFVPEDRAVERRVLILSALCSLVQRWLDKKCPPDGRKRIRPEQRLGGFDNWQRLLADILYSSSFHDAAGESYFMANRQAVSEMVSDSDGEAAGLVAFWFDKHGEKPIGAKDLQVPEVLGTDETPGLVALTGYTESSRAVKLGHVIKKMTGRTFEISGSNGEAVTLRLETAGSRNHAQQYRLRVVRRAEAAAPVEPEPAAPAEPEPAAPAPMLCFDCGSGPADVNGLCADCDARVLTEYGSAADP